MTLNLFEEEVPLEQYDPKLTEMTTAKKTSKTTKKRTRKSSKSTRSERMDLRLYPNEKELIFKYAEERNLNPTDYLREAGLKTDFNKEVQLEVAKQKDQFLRSEIYQMSLLGFIARKREITKAVKLLTSTGKQSDD